MTISARLGLAVVAGVPVLVLVSMGPVAALSGPPSVGVWALSALIGFFMALAFANLAASFPHLTGGVGVLAGRVFEPRGRAGRATALVTQWSYWFGWSPALAINGVLIGGYLRDLLFPQAPSWSVAAFATLVLGGSVTVNHFGLRAGALLQVLLVVCVLGALALVIGGALASGAFDPGHLGPFVPPGGWLSGDGLIAIVGGLFIAGWSAYGAELALAYGKEYRRGARDAVGTLVLVAVIGVAAYTIVPLLLVGVVGMEAIRQDSAVALSPLAEQAAGQVAWVVTAMLMAAALIGLNMLTIASSRTLYQMARNGDAWRFLGRLNRHGVPSNALRFDLAVNAVLLVAVLVITQGRTAAVPVVLVAAANVGYFLSISLALFAAWLNHRARGRPRRFLRIRPALMHVGLGVAVFNLILLAGAGLAWGWSNVGIGIVALAAVIAVFALGGRRAVAPLRPRPEPICLAAGARPATAGHHDPPIQRQERRGR